MLPADDDSYRNGNGNGGGAEAALKVMKWTIEE